MAIRLTAWLEDAFESQLLLGNQWLQDQHEKKKSRSRQEIDRQRSAYHDNGSSLDTINYPDPEHNCILQVLKACTTIAARKYTVRFTSYGPPPERLRLVLNQIDWLGESCELLQTQGSATLRSLHACKQIGRLLEQLRHIRALEDRRRLAPGVEEADVEAKDDAAVDATRQNNNMSDRNALHSQMQDTQAPFATQKPRPSRPRASEDEPQIIGVNRLEPVMAGDTQRVEIRPGAADTDFEKRNNLLNLLNLRPKPCASTHATTSGSSFIQDAFRKPQNAPALPADESPESPSDPSHQQPTQLETEVENGEPASSAPNYEKMVKKAGDISPKVAKAAEHSRVEEQDIQQSLIEDSSDKPPECSWMKDLVFNSETLQVPRSQAQCLSKETSWLKPPPGVQPFQNGNMPYSILKNIHLIADERAAAETDSESDADPSPESPDSSPESLAPKMQDEEPATTQEDDDTASQVTWQSSPEPPERLPRRHEELPPDSSMEKQASHSHDDNPADLLSSPPGPAASADSDEEMEMEESVPQALGEDLAQRKQPPSAIDKLPDAVSLRSPIIHVKETPYGKGKNASEPKNAQKSSSASKPTSSTSIVHSTYDTPSLSDLADVGNFESVKEYPSHTQEKDIGSERKEVEVHHGKAKDVDTDNVEDVEMLDMSPAAQDLNKEDARVVVAPGQLPNGLDGEGVLTSASHATPYSVHLSQNNGDLDVSPTVPHHPPQPTKRKLISSPTKSNRRQPKRREIKIVGFGDDVSSNVDLVGSLRKDREESLRRFREQRNSSTTSFENQPELESKPTVDDDSDIMEIDGFDQVTKREPSSSLSPRHQGLYDEPSPRRAQPIASPEPQPSHSHASFQAHPSDTLTRGPAPIHAEPLSISSEDIDEDSNTTVFQSFKAAYPEYNGNEKHFENQCNQMYQLEQEDKMVPKWQWDDFIIRNRTDYSQYAMDCIDQGENPEPYYRFYKDNIRNTLYTRGIIQNTKTLQRALEELGVARTETSRPRQPPQSIQKPKPARKSLPGAFEQPRKSTHDRVSGNSSRPRHSLPANPHVRPKSRVQPASPASSSRPQSKYPNPKLDDQGSSRDKFKDFYFGYQRITSLTGSTAVDGNKQWPQNLAGRPTVADVLPPRKKVDVLDWGDVLGKMG
ncbi:unnamed protein product [Alternaria alternata]